MPVLLAGSAGGALQTGRYVDYRHQGQPIYYDCGGACEVPTDYCGRPYNSLLISILEAFGVPASEWEKPSGGIGTYSGSFQSQYSVPDGKKALPYLAA